MRTIVAVLQFIEPDEFFLLNIDSSNNNNNDNDGYIINNYNSNNCHRNSNNDYNNKITIINKKLWQLPQIIAIIIINMNRNYLV